MIDGRENHDLVCNYPNELRLYLETSRIGQVVVVRFRPDII